MTRKAEAKFRKAMKLYEKRGAMFKEWCKLERRSQTLYDSYSKKSMWSVKNGKEYTFVSGRAHDLNEAMDKIDDQMAYIFEDIREFCE